MPFLLDTTAISETRKPAPNRGYVSWLEQRNVGETFIGSPTIGELFQCIAPLNVTAERERLFKWTLAIMATFEERILSFDAAAARVWGEANGDARRHGRVLPFVDAQLAAIAAVNGLTVVTWNVRHFRVPEFEGLSVLNPWT